MQHSLEPFTSRGAAKPQCPLRRCGLLRRALFALTLMTFVTLLFVDSTRAQVPTLEGETLQNANPKLSTIDCFGDIKGGQITFTIQGMAVGPYPGTFSETGSISFDFSGAVVGGDITFTIFDENSNAVSKGTKRPFDGKAFCTVDKNTGLTTLGANIPTLEYSAKVEASTDSGAATLDLFASIDKTLGVTTLQFTEIFHSSHVVHSTLGKVTGGGNIIPADRNTGVTFGFNAQNTENGMKGSGTVIDHNAGIKVKILDVQTFVISGTHATFTGRAEVNGVEERYQIDVDDLGEPGASLDSFKIVTDSYGGGGTLSGGNIQIHK